MTTAVAPPTILVVDDAPERRAQLCADLSADYRVFQADSGPAALELLPRARPDLVLIDEQLQHMSTPELCRALKAADADGLLPIILLSSRDRAAGLEAGADDCLTRPVDRRELALRVSACLRLRAQDAQIRRQFQEIYLLQALKEDMLTLVVHDLRNPLASMDAFVQLLQEQLKTPEQASLRRFADKALESSARLRQLLDDVLEVNLLEQGQLPVELAPLDLAALAVEAIATVAGAANARHIRIHSPQESATVSGDRQLVRRAIENLLANALKYSPSGAEIRVAVIDNGAGAGIEIRDRGPQVPDHMKAYISHKVGTAEALRGKTRRSFGLGLHLVQMVAAVHGGAVVVEDSEGGGATFRLTFPRPNTSS